MNNTYLRAQQLRKKDAKFPFVKIGSQYWTLKNHDLSVTPQGTVIPEMQANGNVEKVVNGGFDADISWIKNTGWSISGGKANHIGSGSTLDETPGHLNIGKYYKITFEVSNYTSGNIGINGTVIAGGYYVTANGTYTRYIKAASGQLSFYSNGSCSIDNISTQEIGWSGSQELYNGIYSQTGGTVEQKTYAAVKAAAMWSNYNNDVAIGAVYGKLYNWFAVKLLQMDIDYYNAANPTKKWGGGWRVPTQAEFQTLSTYLGGDAVSGGHLKETGLAHWNSPNTGATNESGFSALPSGNRISGVFNVVNQYFQIHSISDSGNTDYILSLALNSASTQTVFTAKERGESLRLIKA